LACVVAVPTTYAGSEMTPLWGVTQNGGKTTGRDKRVLPKVVVYDPELTMSIPPDLTVASAVNALAHAAEARYAPDGSPVTSLVAEESIRAMVMRQELEVRLSAGTMKFKTHVAEGLENLPTAFHGLFAGESFGKPVVKVSSRS
jgi:alcohol dehydrogenase class IV